MRRAFGFVLFLTTFAFAQDLSGTALCTALQKFQDIVEALRYILPGFLFVGGLLVGGIFIMRERFKEGASIVVASVILAVILFYGLPFLKTGLEKLSTAVGC